MSVCFFPAPPRVLESARRWSPWMTTPASDRLAWRGRGGLLDGLLDTASAAGPRFSPWMAPPSDRLGWRPHDVLIETLADAVRMMPRWLPATSVTPPPSGTGGQNRIRAGEGGAYLPGGINAGITDLN